MSYNAYDTIPAGTTVTVTASYSRLPFDYASASDFYSAMQSTGVSLAGVVFGDTAIVGDFTLTGQTTQDIVESQLEGQLTAAWNAMLTQYTLPMGALHVLSIDSVSAPGASLSSITGSIGAGLAGAGSTLSLVAIAAVALVGLYFFHEFERAT